MTLDALWFVPLGLLAQATRGLPMLAAFALLFTALGAAGRPCNAGRPWWRKPDLLLDLAHWLALPVVGAAARVAFIGAGAALVLGGLNGPALDATLRNGHGWLARLPFWVQVAAYFVLSDVMLYWTHRTFHTARLWPFHAVHHATEQVEWTTATRFHPVNFSFHAVLVDCVLLLAGLPAAALAVIAPFNSLISFLVHANLDWTFGPFRYVIASPVFHRWHHTGPDQGGERNFAPTFPVIDLVFGTFHMPPGVLPDGYGVDDPSYPRTLAGQWFYPFRRRASPLPVGEG